MRGARGACGRGARATLSLRLPVVAQFGRALKEEILAGVFTADLSFGTQMLLVQIQPTGYKRDADSNEGYALRKGVNNA